MLIRIPSLVSKIGTFSLVGFENRHFSPHWFWK